MASSVTISMPPASQVVHRADHGIRAFTVHTFAAAGPGGCGAPGAHHPGLLGHVDRGHPLIDPHLVLGHLRAVTAVPGGHTGRPPQPAALPVTSVSFFFPAAIAASLSLACQQERGCPGSGTGESRI